MNFAILHYHLNRGGVTSVIHNHLRSLDAAANGERHRVAIVHGGRREAWDDSLPDDLSSVEVSLHPVPELEYDADRRSSPDVLYGDLKSVFEKLGFHSNDIVLHVHNHALGKNLALPPALRMLAEDGFGLLLHVHDFAEDLRPDNYRRMREKYCDRLVETLYPQAGNIHYAVLNGRDRGILCDGVVDPARVHFLPNPVVPFPELPPARESREKLNRSFSLAESTRWIVFPVRGIRRKNVGEMLLWGAVFGDDYTYGVTLPPLNPAEAKSYNAWKLLSEELNLNCRFNLGDASTGLSFLEILSAADAALTTSIAEGFGMVFLETWLAGNWLLGRDLPEITADFKADGVTFDGLSPAFRVPTGLVGEEEFRRRFAMHFEDVAKSYGLPSLIDVDALAGLTADGSVDFARLDGELQSHVVRQAAEDNGVCDDIRALNSVYAKSLEADGDAKARTIDSNAAVVSERYSPEQCGRRLLTAYRAVLDSPRDSRLESHTSDNSILRHFLRVDRFYHIRCES